MITQILILSIALLPSQAVSNDNEEIWKGRTYSETQTVEIVGTSTGTTARDALLGKTPRRQLTQDELNRLALINKYGLEEVQALENGTHNNVDLMLLTYLPGETPQSHLVTIRDVASLGIGGGSVSLQPSRGWGYVNKTVYLKSDAKPVTKETTILENTVTITATPVSYTWRLGDGHSFTTKDPGDTWEKGGKVTYSYTRPGTYTLSADITWRASYTVNGNTYPVNGTLTTTSTAQTIKIVEAEAVLKN